MRCAPGVTANESLACCANTNRVAGSTYTRILSATSQGYAQVYCDAAESAVAATATCGSAETSGTPVPVRGIAHQQGYSASCGAGDEAAKVTATCQGTIAL